MLRLIEPKPFQQLNVCRLFCSTLRVAFLTARGALRKNMRRWCDAICRLVIAAQLRLIAPDSGVDRGDNITVSAGRRPRARSRTSNSAQRVPRKRNCRARGAAAPCCIKASPEHTPFARRHSHIMYTAFGVLGDLGMHRQPLHTFSLLG